MKSWIENKCRILKIEFLTLFYNSHISSDYVFDTLVQVPILTSTCFYFQTNKKMPYFYFYGQRTSYIKIPFFLEHL